jgi:hypothetical protein
MAENRQYGHEYKVQAVKLAKETGQVKAAKEPWFPKNAMYGWVRTSRIGSPGPRAGSQTPQSNMTLNQELLQPAIWYMPHSATGVFQYTGCPIHHIVLCPKEHISHFCL